jgi:hypothetical protein
MLNEELATFLLLERTNMQHVERSNDYMKWLAVLVRYSRVRVQSGTMQRSERMQRICK